MLSICTIIAASFLRFLDPYTCLYQTDDDVEGRRLSAEPGYWLVPNGLKDPQFKKNPRAHILYSVYRISADASKEYDESKPSDLFKVNQVGYLPWAPKFAYMGAWLGPKLGKWRPHEPMKCWRLVDSNTGECVFESQEGPRVRIEDGYTKSDTPFTGEDTYEMDFSSITNTGVYHIEVPGVGRSRDFAISAEAPENAFRIHMQGLYHKRCGIAKEEPWTHWTSPACHTNIVRGTFPPEEGRLEPKRRMFAIIRYNTAWDCAERLNLSGGWHDAADHDRRPVHMNIVSDLCAVYLMRPQNFRDGQLYIPESSNGIPDILDEAEWGLRHLLAAQQQDGGVPTWIEAPGIPATQESAAQDSLPYALSRATRRSSLMYAAHAALLARCHDSFKAKYLDSAIRAWRYAMTRKPESEVFEIKKKKYKIFTESELVDWYEDEELPAQYLVKAAVNLHALTGDKTYLKMLDSSDAQIKKDISKNAWSWPPLIFSGEKALGWPEALDEYWKQWQRKTLNVARGICDQIESSYAYRAPWWAPQQGWVHAMSWGQSHPLRRAQYLIAAHGMTGEEKYLAAASLANDFHNGCNPQGTTLTSGLGEVYPVVFLDIPSYNDGIAEYIGGISPYRWTYGIPANAVKMVYGGDKDFTAKWPIWRRWGNLENQTVAASEYTVWETIAPAASVTGYLIDTPTSGDPRSQRRPATDITSLPGYWPLP